jgi:hypothetical protein
MTTRTYRPRRRPLRPPAELPRIACWLLAYAGACALAARLAAWVVGSPP